MTNVFRSLALLALAIAIATGLAACRTSKKENIYTFDAAAHERAVEARGQALALMATSGESFATHKAEAEALGVKMAEGYELAAAAPDNQLIAGEWAALKDPAGDLYGGFVRRWQSAGRIDDSTREAAIARVTVRFDYLLCLEAAKRTKGGRCAPPGGAVPATPAAEGAPAAAPPA